VQVVFISPELLSRTEMGVGFEIGISFPVLRLERAKLQGALSYNA
tara:strand:+ start:300 stop:434 length:135 start_codon:yes stop_codon:yes gene_type:complete